MRCPKCQTNWVAGVTHCDLCDIDMQAAAVRPKKTARKRKRSPSKEGLTWNRFMGGIGVVWGGAVVLYWILMGLPLGLGNLLGMLTGVAMLAAGTHSLRRG